MSSSRQDRFKLFAAAYLVLLDNGQILMQKRCNTGYQDGNYSLIAGHLDGGETSKQCIIREAKEEAGIILKADDLDIIHIMHHLGADREYFLIFLRAEKWSGNISILEPQKCDELTWYPLADLPENTTPELKAVLGHIQKNEPFGEFGWAAN